MTTIAGYCIRWSDEAEVDGHHERFERGAFAHAISTRLCCAHGRAVAYRVPVRETAEGLYFKAELDDAKPEHQSLIAAIRDGVDGVSIRYVANRTSWQSGVEVVESAYLREISVAIGDPAYPNARCWVVQESPAPDPEQARGVGQTVASAKPLASPVRMRPAGLGISASLVPTRPVAPTPTDPLRAAVVNYMARYISRGLA